MYIRFQALRAPPALRASNTIQANKSGAQIEHKKIKTTQTKDTETETDAHMHTHIRACLHTYVHVHKQ